jgi:hypothetical protein
MEEVDEEEEERMKLPEWMRFGEQKSWKSKHPA